jgi:membrane-associated phospholipid phosphatase
MALRIPILLAALTVGAAIPAHAQVDSAGRGNRSPLVTRREAVVGLAGTAASIALMRWDPDIAHWMQKPEQQSSGAWSWAGGARHVNERSLFVAEMVLWGTGRLTHNESLADVSWHAAEAVGITTVGTQIVRIAVGRSRPFVTGDDDQFDFKPFKGRDSQAYRSIPSLHAAASFATAAVLTGETHRRRPGLVKVVAPVSFAAATLPGLGRMYADKHWASDVALGAVWGTMIGIATVRWHHEHDDRMDRWMLGASVAPGGRAHLTLTRELPRW